MYKFKIGDKVKYCGNLVGVIGCIEYNRAYMSSCSSATNEFRYPQGGTCPIHNTFMGYGLDDLTLVESNKITFSPANFTEGNWIDKKMSSIKEFAKNLLLSNEDKVLRQAGLQDSYGEYTQDARDLVIAKLVEENKAYLVEIAEKKEAEENK